MVGANGAGKTTLLRLLAGDLVADAGSISIRPAGGERLLCPQEVESSSPQIGRFAVSDMPSARRLIGALRLRPCDLERWPTLSPGERKRWQIGAALALEPAVLLLDEPTNHLEASCAAASSARAPPPRAHPRRRFLLPLRESPRPLSLRRL